MLDMNLRASSGYIAAAALVATLLLPSSIFAAEKLKGFYSGSGGIAESVHRVVIVQFGADGTALVQQNWQDKPPQTWHVHWTLKDKVVTFTFDPVKGKPTPDPLVCTIKHGALVPTSWDYNALGFLGPPTLAPFAGKNPQSASVDSCVSINVNNPNNQCVTWGTSQ
jgi:hypothetical protein